VAAAKTSPPVCSICHVAWRRTDGDETRVEGDEAAVSFQPPPLFREEFSLYLQKGTDLGSYGPAVQK
jgi:hypothetical protein